MGGSDSVGVESSGGLISLTEEEKRREGKEEGRREVLTGDGDERFCHNNKPSAKKFKRRG
jgi:hypothetical protein